jgi:hypothetical protein
MGRPRIPYEVVRVALFELARGATIDEAAAAAGVSPRSVDQFVCEHGRMTLREATRRPGALTFQDREEIRVGIERDESNTQIGERIGKDRSTVWREIGRNGDRDAYRAWRATIVPMRQRNGRVRRGLRPDRGCSRSLLIT